MTQSESIQFNNGFALGLTIKGNIMQTHQPAQVVGTNDNSMLVTSYTIPTNKWNYEISSVSRCNGFVTAIANWLVEKDLGFSIYRETNTINDDYGTIICVLKNSFGFYLGIGAGNSTGYTYVNISISHNSTFVCENSSTTESSALRFTLEHASNFTRVRFGTSNPNGYDIQRTIRASLRRNDSENYIISFSSDYNNPSDILFGKMQDSDDITYLYYKNFLSIPEIGVSLSSNIPYKIFGITSGQISQAKLVLTKFIPETYDKNSYYSYLDADKTIKYLYYGMVDKSIYSVSVADVFDTDDGTYVDVYSNTPYLVFYRS